MYTAPVKGLRSVALQMLEALQRISLVTTRSAHGDVGLLGRFSVGAPVADCRRCGGVSGNRILIRGLLTNAGVTLVASTNAPNVSSPKRRLTTVYCRTKVRIASLPNPTTYVATLALSNLRAEHFTFRTFLPTSGGRQGAVLRRLSYRAEAVVLCRTPRELMQALNRLERTLNGHQVALYERLAGGRRATFQAAVSSLVSFCGSRGPLNRYILIVRNEDHDRVRTRGHTS